MSEKDIKTKPQTITKSGIYPINSFNKSNTNVAISLNGSTETIIIIILTVIALYGATI